MPFKLNAGQIIVDNVIKDLDDLGLRYTIQDVYDKNTAEGNIIRTNPAAGTEVTPSTDEKEGTMITLYVSKGAEPVQTNPPQTEPSTQPPDTEPVETNPADVEETTGTP